MLETVVAPVNVFAPDPLCTRPAPPASFKSSVDSSHNAYAPEVAPNNFTSYPVSSTPTVRVLETVVAPVNVFAPAPLCTRAAPPTSFKSSVDSSHNAYAPEVAPNNFTSYPVSSTPTVTVASA